MKVAGSDGSFREMSKQTRMRAMSLLVDRDLLMLEKYYEGRSQAEVAKMFKVSRPLVSHRIRMIPADVKARMREMVEESIRIRGYSHLAEAEISIVRVQHRRNLLARRRGLL